MKNEEEIQLNQTVHLLKDSSCESEEKVKFIFSDGSSKDYNKEVIDLINPFLLTNITKTNNYYNLRVPFGIFKEELSQFLFIYINNKNILHKPLIGNSIEKLYSILKLMEFFNNEEFNINLISYFILPEVNKNLAIELIIFSYDKLCYYSENGKQADNAYFELFYQSLEELSKNELILINNFEKIKILNKDIIEELFQKTFRNLIYNNYKFKNENEIVSVNKENGCDYFELNEIKSTKNFETKNESNDNNFITLNNFRKLIYFLMEINDINNIFGLLTKEYMTLLSSESLDELKNMPNPSFKVRIPFKLLENYYEEFPIDINITNYTLSIIIFYKIVDKSINIYFKLSNKNKAKKLNDNGKEYDILATDNNNENKNDSCFGIFTFLTNVIITKGSERNQITTSNSLISLSDNKSMFPIIRVPHFDEEFQKYSTIKKNSRLYTDPNDNSNTINYTNNENISTYNENELKSDDRFFTITIQIKLCYIYSAICSYLLNNFYEYSNDPNISKISKQLLILLFKNKNIKIKNSNDIIKSLLLWLDDEINIKEDISQIFYSIKWDEVDEDLLFELLIKYSHIILDGGVVESYFLSIVLNKIMNKTNLESIIKSIFNGIKKIGYLKLICQLKKMHKILSTFNINGKNEIDLYDKCLINKTRNKNFIPNSRKSSISKCKLVNNGTQTNSVIDKLYDERKLLKKKFMHLKHKSLSKNNENKIDKYLNKSAKTTSNSTQRSVTKNQTTNYNIFKNNLIKINIENKLTIKNKNIYNSENRKKMKKKDIFSSIDKNENIISISTNKNSKIKEVILYPTNFKTIKKYSEMKIVPNSFDKSTNRSIDIINKNSYSLRGKNLSCNIKKKVKEKTFINNYKRCNSENKSLSKGTIQKIFIFK